MLLGILKSGVVYTDHGPIHARPGMILAVSSEIEIDKLCYAGIAEILKPKEEQKDVV